MFWSRCANRPQHRGQLSRIIHAGHDAHDGTGKPDFEHRRRRMWYRLERYGLGDDRNKTRRHGSCRLRGARRHITTRGAAPAEHLLRTELPATSNLGDPRSWFQCLRDNPGLLVHRPSAATARSRQNLDTSKGNLRVVVSVKHKDSSKPVASAKETTSGEGIKQGRRSSAYRCLAGLVRKSLIVAEFDGTIPRFRFLETTRVYAMGKLSESGECEAIMMRHACLKSGLTDTKATLNNYRVGS